MTDVSDQATVREEIQREEAMLFRKPTVKACGFCHNCSDKIGTSEIFCSVDCRDDFQRAADSRFRGGL